MMKTNALGGTNDDQIEIDHVQHLTSRKASHAYTQA